MENVHKQGVHVKLPWFLHEGFDRWTRYVNYLNDSFHEMPRSEQERTIRKGCMIGSMGATVSVSSLVYRSLPLALRLLGLPTALIGTYILAQEIISPWIIRRLDKYLKRSP